VSADHYVFWRRQQQDQLSRLRSMAQLPVVELPHLLDDIDGPAIEQLSRILLAGMASHPLTPDATQGPA